MPAQPSATVQGRWAPGSCGGCPKTPAYTDNPQYLLAPDATGTFTIRLACNVEPPLEIGFVVLRQSASNPQGRKTDAKVTKSELVHKTKWKATNAVTAEVELPGAGSGYIVLPCTYEPGHSAAFELSVVSSGYSATQFTLTPLGGDGGAAGGSYAPPPAPPTAAAAAAGYSGGGGGGGYGGGGRATGDSTSSTMKPSAKAAAEGLAEGEVQVRSEGQGLSSKQKRDAKAKIEAALSACASSPTGKWEDPDFPAAASSLWKDGAAPGGALAEAGVRSDLVSGWRRPSEFGAEYEAADGSPRLFYTDWGVQGVVASPLLNHWLLAAMNIVGGDLDILEKVFVDTSHVDKGFYGVRFYVDDPNSDDDWEVVLVDDRLPCGEDGLPCFAKCPSPVVLWVSILEKAFAKLKGCYEATGGGSVDDGLLYLTGGLSREVGLPPSADRPMVDALWQQMMEWWMTAHVIGCEHRIESAPSAEFTATGLLPNTPYCVVTGGEPSKAGRMVRLRTFHGFSEWRGKWSDSDPAWTSQLRQSLAYSDDKEDGTFWMSFDDFVTWFNVLYTCRMADDRWSTVTTRSRWQDETAGGCVPNYASWRTNPQWLLRTSRPLRLTVSLSTETTDDAISPDAAIGVSVLLGNSGADARRRKLLLHHPEELVVRAEPRPVRRLVSEISLEGSETPYVVMPHTFMPGREAKFTLTLRADDTDDDGNADFTLEPVRPDKDWHSALVLDGWAAALARGAGHTEGDTDVPKGYDPAAYVDPAKYAGAGGPPGSAGASANPQIRLAAPKGGRFWIFVDQIGLSQDGRSIEGGAEAEGGPLPAVGVALTPGAAMDDGEITVDELLQNQPPMAADSVVLACELAACEAPYIILPYLEAPAEALHRHPQLAYRVYVYSDQSFTLGGAESDDAGKDGEGNHICWGMGLFPHAQSEHNCLQLKVFNSLRRMEKGLDAQLKRLDTLAAHPTSAALQARP